MPRNLDLIELMRGHFVVSKRLLRCSILCNVGVVAVSLSTSSNVFPGTNIYIPISLLLVQFGAYVLRQVSINHFSSAENVRSTVMLKAGLDLDISESHLKRLYRPSNPSTVQDLPFLAPYYAPQLHPGPGILLHMLAENCTYTKRVARKSFKLLAAVTTITVLGVVGLISLMIHGYATRTILANINMFTLALLSFWATLDVSTLRRRFHELHHRCSHILSKCDELQRANVNRLDEIMHLVSEYNRALAASSPFPTKFYEASKADLSKLWPTRIHIENRI